jgi:hypothetical protein
VIAVFDVDGVLADASHRQHHVESRPKDWEAFFAEVGGDTLLEHGRRRLLDLAADHEIVLLSGRPEGTRADTLAWLTRQGLGGLRLVLRPDSDHRRAADFKASVIGEIGSPDEVALVLDDDPSITARLAMLGYRVELFR